MSNTRTKCDVRSSGKCQHRSNKYILTRQRRKRTKHTKKERRVGRKGGGGDGEEGFKKCSIYLCKCVLQVLVVDGAIVHYPYTYTNLKTYSC